MLTDGVLQQAYIEANIGTHLSDEMLKKSIANGSPSSAPTKKFERGTFC